MKKILFAVVSIFMTFTTFLLFIVPDDELTQIMLKLEEKTEKLKLTAKKETDQSDPLDTTYQHGLDLLALNNPSVHGYVKELVTLYSDSAAGKLDDSPVHLSVTSLLGMHLNESGTYAGTPILESYIPLVSNEIMWNKVYSGLPAEEMSLRRISHKTVEQVPNIDNQVNTHATDWNVFQTRNSYYQRYGGWSPPSKLFGYGYSSNEGRQSDVHFLPDTLAYLNYALKQAGDSVGGFTDAELDPTATGILYSVYHNGGSGVFARRVPFGVESSSKVSASKEEKKKETIAYGNILAKTYSQVVIPADKIQNREIRRFVAVLASVKAGFYLSPEHTEKLKNGGSIPGGTIPRVSNENAKLAWSIVFGEEKSRDEIFQILETKYTKTLKQIDPELTDSDCNNIYGLDCSMSGDGALTFYMGENTSDAYTNKKSNGKSPRVLKTVRHITLLHQFDSSAVGNSVYVAMLKYYGVDTDPTSPGNYIPTLPPDSFQPPMPTPVDDGNLFSRPANGPVTSKFGRRWGKLHAGIDIGKRGQSVPIVAAAEGTVRKAHYSSSYGNVVYISHMLNGEAYETVYAHMESTPKVVTGQKVAKGTLLGYIGNTGRSFGAHLHFEIHKPKWVAKSIVTPQNPANYIDFSGNGGVVVNPTVPDQTGPYVPDEDLLYDLAESKDPNNPHISRVIFRNIKYIKETDVKYKLDIENGLYAFYVYSKYGNGYEVIKVVDSGGFKVLEPMKNKYEIGKVYEGNLVAEFGKEGELSQVALHHLWSNSTMTNYAPMEGYD